MRQKKRRKKLWVAVVLLANCFFGGGKCPNLGVVNVRILGVVNVLLANDSQSDQGTPFFMVAAIKDNRNDWQKNRTSGEDELNMTGKTTDLMKENYNDDDE